MVLGPRDLVPLTHTFFNTLYKHYRNETPESTWDLKLHLSVELLRCVLQHSKHKTIETHQKFTASTYFATVSSSMLVHKATVPETSRSQAEDILAGLLSGQEENIGWRWKEDPMRQKPLKAEWIEEKKRNLTRDVDRVILYVHGGAYCLGSPAQSRFFVSKVAKAAGARAFSIDYRLAPQSPFPAAVIDALAAYLYLIQPPANSGLDPINPSNIVIMGDSAGGGLSLAIMLLLRDAGLPQPAACVCWSPWVDLYHSLPSVMENSATDYLPDGIAHKPSPANPIKDYKNLQERMNRIHYYACNSALNCPYVSPLLAKDLGGLGQLYITCGNAERLRDESILFAYKASKTCPDLFEADNTNGQHEYEPTKVTLHVYDAMPHVFQIFGFHPAAMDGISRTASFIRKVIPSRPSSPGNRSPERRNDDSNDLPSPLCVTEIHVNNAREDEDGNEDEFASEDELMLIKRFSVDGKSREFEGMEKQKLKEWVDALGKLPEFAKNPDVLRRLLDI